MPLAISRPQALRSRQVTRQRRSARSQTCSTPQSSFVEHAKRESSKFVKTLGAEYKKFFWQRGYGMFSVGPTRRAEVEKYVRNQEEHHRTMTFQEEFLMFLKRYGVEYDEAYVSD